MEKNWHVHLIILGELLHDLELNLDWLTVLVWILIHFLSCWPLTHPEIYKDNYFDLFNITR